MATIEQVRDAMQHAPFTVKLLDGRSFRINHRDFISVSPDRHGRGVAIHEGGHLIQVDVLLIQSLEYADPAANVEPTNGPAAGGKGA